MLNELEINVLEQILKSEKFDFNLKDLRKFKVIRRAYDAVGVFTNIEPHAIQGSGIPITFSGGNVGAVLNGQIDAGFVLFIRDGYVQTLEGYTCLAEWPEKIENFQLYLSNPSNVVVPFQKMTPFKKTILYKFEDPRQNLKAEISEISAEEKCLSIFELDTNRLDVEILKDDLDSIFRQGEEEFEISKENWQRIE